MLVSWFGEDGPCSATEREIPDPYSGDPLTASGADIDHIYPLSAAWDFGAHAWDAEKRLKFANDPLNLIPVSSSLNRTKSDLTPGEWLPPGKPEACVYSTRYLAVAGMYRLPVSTTDREALNGTCGIPWWTRLGLG